MINQVKHMVKNWDMKTIGQIMGHDTTHLVNTYRFDYYIYRRFITKIQLDVQPNHVILSLIDYDDEVETEPILQLTAPCCVDNIHNLPIFTVSLTRWVI
jgi:hypothetical protein